MSHIWTFSPSSEELLQKCIAAAPPPDANNKWVLAFQRKHQESEPKHNLTCTNSEKSPANVLSNVEENNDVLEGYEELLEIIEADPASRWDYLVEECNKNHKLFILLAERLSAPSIERLCKHALAAKNINWSFMDNFCRLFITHCVKREYNRHYLDFFVGIYKLYPNSYKILLEFSLQDVNVPSKMLSDFITFLNESEQKEFITNMLYIKLSAEGFVHHLPSIYTTYQISKKTDEIDNYIFSNLIQYNAICSHDRNYGKLFLAYLQNQKVKNKPINVRNVKDLLDNHKTPFRKPCEKILDDAAE